MIYHWFLNPLESIRPVFSIFLANVPATSKGNAMVASQWTWSTNNLWAHTYLSSRENIGRRSHHLRCFCRAFDLPPRQGLVGTSTWIASVKLLRRVDEHGVVRPVPQHVGIADVVLRNAPAEDYDAGLPRTRTHCLFIHCLHIWKKEIEFICMTMCLQEKRVVDMYIYLVRDRQPDRDSSRHGGTACLRLTRRLSPDNKRGCRSETIMSWWRPLSSSFVLFKNRIKCCLF